MAVTDGRVALMDTDRQLTQATDRDRRAPKNRDNSFALEFSLDYDDRGDPARRTGGGYSGRRAHSERDRLYVCGERPRLHATDVVITGISSG